MPASMIAQSSANYTFATNATGSLALDQGGNAVNMATGTTQLIGAGLDANASAVTSIGFDFYFMGNRFTQFSVQEDGILQLGATTVGTNVYTLTGGTVTSPRLSAFNADLRTGTTTGKIHYKLVGTAPNRALVVEFTDMQLFYTGTGTAGTSTWQMRLYENGNVEYVYGTMSATSIAAGDRAASIGFYTGAAAGSFASVAFATHTSATTGTYTANPAIAATGDIVALTSTANGSRRVYSYNAPASAANPTGLNFTAVTALSTTVNWTDNSIGEFGFVVTRATDAAFTANVVTTTVLSTTSAGQSTAYTSAQTGLTPSTLYYYKVAAYNEGPPAVSGVTSSVSTLATGTITSTGNGLWSNAATWSTNAVPTSGDNVTIQAGHVVTQDVVAAAAYTLNVSGSLVYDVTPAKVLTVVSNVTINAGGSITGPATGTVVTHGLVIGGNLVNNGTLDLSTNTNTAGVILTFNGSNTATFTGTGTSDLFSLAINKASRAIIVEINVSNFTVRGLATLATGALLTTNTGTGTLKISGTNTFDGSLWDVNGYAIGTNFGLWLNNPNFTVNGLGGSATVQGLFRISAGTYNIGTGTGNSLGFNTGSTVTVEGGTINSTSRFGVAAAANVVNYTQTGGTINVNSIGNTSTTLASFDLGTSTTSTTNITGGTVNVILANTGGSGPRDVRGSNIAAPTITGGAINFGTAASGAAKTFFALGSIPGFTMNNASANHSVTLAGITNTWTNTVIPTGSTLTLGAFTYFVRGATFTNNGIVNATAASSNFYFFSATPQTINGAGTYTPGITSLSADTSSQLILDPAVTSMVASRVNLFTGTIVNSNKITLGNAGAAIVQIGATGLTTPGGSFDVAPNFNLGSGTYSVLYQPESVARTTGFEIPATRTANVLTVNNSNGVTIVGGPLEVTGTLTLTSGIVTTTETNNLVLGNATAAGTLSGGSATAFINGPFRRSFLTRTATGTYGATTLFPVGKATTYLPMHIDPTVTGPVIMSGEAFTTNAGTQGGGVTTLGANRWEGLIKSGNANFTNSFIRVADALTVATNKIIQAPSAAGAYGSIIPATTFAAGTPNTLTTATALLAANYTGYFSYGNLNICPVPTTQATALVVSNLGATFFNASFTEATGTPSHYLVVRYASGATPTNPADYTAYVAGGTLGTGTVVAVLTAPANSFAQTGLTAGTTYDYYVYSYNNLSCYGPSYNTVTPLLASVTTCATATTVPTALAAGSTTTTGTTISWTANAADALQLDIATNATFTTFLPGYNSKPLAAGTTSEVVAGLTASTTYYVRLRAISGTCFSSYSSTLTFTTECNAEVAPTVVQNFTTYLPTCWSEAKGAIGSAFTIFASDWLTSTGFANAGTNAGAKINLYGGSMATPDIDWLISNPIDLGTTPKRIVFDMAVTSFNGTTVQTTLGTHKVNVLVSTNGGQTWAEANSVKLYTGAATYSNTGQQEVINLMGYTGVVKIAFVATTVGLTPDIDFHIDNFRVEALQSPTITSFASTVACGDATVLTITGTNLTGGTVTINGTPFTPTSVTDTQIVIPVNTSVIGNIVITTVGGTATSATAFSFTNAPAFTLSASSATICSGSSSSLITVTAGASDYNTFVWSPATGVTGNQTSGYTFNANASGVYTLTASQSAGSCSRTATFTLTVNASPSALVISPSTVTVCEGSTQALTATGAVTSISATVGNATTLTGLTNQPTAFCNRFDHYWSQMVFTAAELNAVGIFAGNINSIKFNITSLGSANNVTDFKVYIAPTALTTLTTFTTTGLTQVFSAATYSQTIGLNTIAFSTPYAWDGTSNLIIDVRQTGIDSANNAETYYTATTGNNTVLYAITSTVNAGGSDGFANSAPAPTTSVNRLNTTFDYTATAPVTWTPSTGLFTDAAGTVAYTGTATSTVYVKGSTTTATSYTATATNATTCSSSASVPVTVTITPAPTGTATATFCATNNPTVANLTATGTAIQWYAAATLGSPLASTVALVNGTTYYASQTVSGCESMTRFPVAVTVNTTSCPNIEYANLQFPGSANINQGASIDVYATVFKAGVTEPVGQGANITAWIGYSTTNTDPSTWTNWIPATYNAAAGASNNDEYMLLGFGSTFTQGTYYYASRFQYNGAPFVYGGYSASGGGFYNGTSNVNGVLVVGPPLSTPGFTMNNLKYYPNPVSNVLTVSYTEDITSLKLYNMVGQQIMVKTVNSMETQIDMSQYPAGSYLLEVTSGSKSKTVKLLKNQ